MHAGAPIPIATGLMRRADQHAELPVPLCVCRLGPPAPRVEPARRHVERPTERLHRAARLLRVDERKPHAFSLTKKAAAFFRISRSVRSTRISFRNRRSSSRSSVVSPVRPFVRSARARSTQVRKADSVRSSSRATRPHCLAVVEHQPHGARLELLVKLPAWSPGLRRLEHRGHRIRLSERVHETGGALM